MELKKKSEVIKEISGKEVWEEHENTRIEEQCMSPHIVEHIDEISEITGYDLEVTDTELFVGDFRADIVCKDANTGDIIVIENQLGRSDHDHIGKSFTYLANLGAKAIVWICENARPEHVKAVEWFNENTPDDVNFFMLELKFGQLNNNSSFYYFNNVFIPSSINKIANNINRKMSVSMLDNVAFMENFIQQLKEKISTAKTCKGKTYAFINKMHGIDAMLGTSLKYNTISFWLEYHKDKVANPDVTDEYLNKIKDKLNSLGYAFENAIGKKDLNLIKIRYEVALDKVADIDKIEKICIDVDAVMHLIIK